jgi:hypothetical protein
MLPQMGETEEKPGIRQSMAQSNPGAATCKSDANPLPVPVFLPVPLGPEKVFRLIAIPVVAVIAILAEVSFPYA